MGLADRVGTAVASRRVRRASAVTSEEFAELLAGSGGSTGRTRAGVTMGVNRALGITAWYSGVRYLAADHIPYLPCQQFVGEQSNRRPVADPLWLKRPDLNMPWSALVEHWMMSLLHRGNAYAFKVRDAAGVVVGLRALHPDRVRVGQTGEGLKIFQVDNRVDLAFTPREILHIPGMSYDGIAGLDPIRVHAETLGAIAAADEFAARSFGQGSHVQAYISVPQQLTTAQAEELQAEWERFHRGVANAHTFGVLGNGAEYKTISLDPQQVQLLETRKYGTIEVAQILRMPPHKLYELTRSTNNNIEHQSIEAVTDSIRPWVNRLEDHINQDRDLNPEGFKIEFSLEGMLRGDSKTRAEFHNAGITGGWMSPQVAARLENLPAPDELNYYLRPLNMDVIRPGEVRTEDQAARAREIAELIQKVYLGVDVVLTAEEARDLARRAGAELGPVPPAARQGRPTGGGAP